MSNKYQEIINLSKKSQMAEKSKGRKILELQGHNFNDEGDIVVDLIADTNTGKKNFGKITYEAYKAIENNKLDSYKPKEYEKKVLDGYKQYTGMFTPNNTIPTTNTTQNNNSNGIYVDTNKYGKGNIDLTKRPTYVNEDGKISTVDSMSFNEDGKEVLIPTIVQDKNGKAKRLTEDEAIEHYRQTGEYLGKFDTVEEANKYAQNLHIEQDKYYSSQPETTSNLTDEEKKVLDKYGISATSFSTDDFEAWALEHGYEFNEFKESNADATFVPKYKGFKKVPTKEEQADFKVLSNIAGREYLKQSAEKYPVTFSIGTVAAAPVRGIAGVVAMGKDAATLATDKNINTNDILHNAVENTNIVRETITEKHASNWFGGASGKLGNYGALAYNGLMSIGDTVVNTLVTKGIGSGLGLTGKGLAAFTSNATSGLLASTSGTSKIIENKKEGVSDDKAVASGLATAAAEFITEKISLDLIFSQPSSMLKKGFISFLSEGSEEMTSDVITKTADYFILGDDSTIRKNINKYMQGGMSKKDAVKQATVDSIYETLSAGLVGGLSGVAMSSAYHGFGRSEIKKLGADYRDVAADIIQSGLDSPENSTAYKHAKKLSEKGVNNISDYELGLQHTYNVEQIDYENEQAEKAAKKAVKTTSSVKENNAPFNAPVNPTIFTGDVFKDSASGNTFTIVSRDDNKTVVEIETPKGTATREFGNNRIDNLVSSGQVEKIETTPTVEATPTVENTVVAENATTENKVVDDYESEADELLNTDMSEEETTVDETPTPVAENTSVVPAEDTQTTTPKNITLTKVGDFYEAYGNEAVELAKRLNLKLTSKTINGEKVQMVGFPVHGLESFKKAYGGDYNITVSETPTATSVNEEKLHDGTETSPTEETTPTENVTVAENTTTTEAENKSVAEETTTGHKEATTNDVELAESEILSLKRTKNVYSVFKDSKVIYIGKDFISDGFVAIPLNDKNLEGVKKAAKEADIKNKPDFSVDKIYNKDNDVIIQGEPKINYVQRPDYVFKINDTFYIAQQKYIDAFNNGKSIIKANSKSYSTPWTVHDENGNLLAIIMPVRNNGMTDEVFDSLKSVSEIKQEEAKQKEVKAAEKAETERQNAEYEEKAKQKRQSELERRQSLSTPEELKTLREKYDGKEFTDGDNTYRVEYLADKAWFAFAEVKEDGTLEHFGARLIEPSAAAMEQHISLLEKLKQNNEKNKEIEKTEAEKKAKEQAVKTEEEKYLNSYISGMSPMMAAKVKNTLLKDFNKFIKLHKFVENAVKSGKRLETKDINGKMSYRLYSDDSIFYEINKTAYDYGKYLESIKTDEGNLQLQSDEVLKNQSESDTIEERKTTDNNERVGVENGIDERGSVSEKPEQFSETKKLGNQSKKVQDNLSGNDDSGRGKLELYKRGYSDTSRRIKQVETRKLEDIYSDEKFKTFKDVANDSTPLALVNYLHREVYAKDVRLTEEGYDFEDVFAYDLISGKEKELSALFYDEIAEYFNQNNSTDVDSTGKTITKNTLERLKDSIVRNTKGQLIPVYHSTTVDFEKFEIGDLGFHFGSYVQAYQRNIDKSNVRYIKAYLDIKNPLVFDSDSMGWNGKQILESLPKKELFQMLKH
jgi:hypothetical protein